MKNRRYIRTRNKIAIASWLRPGGGFHGGSAKQQTKRARKDAKQSLRNERYSYGI